MCNWVCGKELIFLFFFFGIKGDFGVVLLFGIFCLGRKVLVDLWVKLLYFFLIFMSLVCSLGFNLFLVCSFLIFWSCLVSVLCWEIRVVFNFLVLLRCWFVLVRWVLRVCLVCLGEELGLDVKRFWLKVE